MQFLILNFLKFFEKFVWVFQLLKFFKISWVFEKIECFNFWTLWKKACCYLLISKSRDLWINLCKKLQHGWDVNKIYLKPASNNWKYPSFGRIYWKSKSTVWLKISETVDKKCLCLTDSFQKLYKNLIKEIAIFKKLPTFKLIFQTNLSV